MKITKKILMIIFIFCITINILKINIEASSNLFLKKLDFAVNVNDDGSMDITETWNINIRNTNTVYKTFNVDNEKYSSITDVKVLEVINNKEIKYTKIFEEMKHVNKNGYYGLVNKNNLFEIAWGVDMENQEGSKTYQISYRVNDAIAKYSDYAELYWQFVGKDFEIDAKKITGKITLPQNVTNKEDIKVWGHTEGLNGTIYATDTNTIEFNINEFRNGRYIEIRSLFPTNFITKSNRTYEKDILNTVILEETNWANEANERRENQEKYNQIKKTLFLIAYIIILILLLVKLIKYIKKYKNMKKLIPTIENKYYREIPDEKASPMEAFEILKEKINIEEPNELGRIFSATLLNLAMKKKIEIEQRVNEKQKEEIIIKKVNEETTDLTKDEEEIYSFILNSKQMTKQNMITTKELEKYISTKGTELLNLKTAINKSVENKLLDEKYYTKESKQEKSKYLGLPYIYMMIIIMSIVVSMVFNTIENDKIFMKIVIAVNVVSLLNIGILILINRKSNIFIQKGIDEKAKWNGLKRYMEEFSMLDKREVPELILWEKYLVYATAFGVAKKVIKQLKMVYPNFNEAMNLNTATYMYLMVNTNFSENFSSSINSAITSTYSSATGAGGGFSGGGGGRWRRRTDGGRQIILKKLY